MRYEFDSEIRILEGKIKWNVIYIPYSVKDLFNTNGKVPIRIIVDGYAFDHTLLPSKNGHFFVYNEFIHRAVQKQIGDSVHVTFEKCKEKREISVPDYITKALENNHILDMFLNQPNNVINNLPDSQTYF